MYAGIEAGGTKFVCAVGTGPDDLADVTTFPTTDPDETLARTGEFLRSHADQLDAVGIASFGPLDLHCESDTYGYITSTPKPGWQSTDVVGSVRAAVDVPVGFDTDVNGAAVGEARWGAAADVDSCVYVTVGTGVGGGALIGARPLHGLLHPEMGHLPVRRHPDDDFAGTCPYHGDCLEGMAAGPALHERWGVPAQDLNGVQREPAVAIEAEYLAQMAAAMVYLLSPARMIFGGGVMQLPGLLEALRTRTVELLNGYIAVPAITEHIDRAIVRPGLGDRAGVLGAIALAADAAAIAPLHGTQPEG